MDFKKKCIQFKKNAKEFGYEIKLTHVQELLSKYEGFENRHAKLAAKKEYSLKMSGVFMYVTTDDNVFDEFVEIDLDSWIWIVENDKGCLELLLQGDLGPDYHTDNLLYNVKNPKLDNVKEYLSVLSKADKSVGYSVSIDDKSVNQWLHNNYELLEKHGYDLDYYEFKK